MEKVKEVVSKNGLYIKLGALVVAFIGMFMDFLKISAKGSKYSISASYLNFKDLWDGLEDKENGLGVLVLILIIVTVVYLLAEKYAKDLYEKVPAKIAPYVTLVTSGVAFLAVLYDAITAKSRMINASVKAIKSIMGNEYAKTYAKELKKEVQVTPQIGCILIALGLAVVVAIVVYEQFFMNKKTAEAK